MTAFVDRRPLPPPRQDPEQDKSHGEQRPDWEAKANIITGTILAVTLTVLVVLIAIAQITIALH